MVDLFKFIDCCRSNGLFCAFRKGLKSLVFLIRKRVSPEYLKDILIVQKNNLKMICDKGRIKFYWKQEEITKGVGLNVSMFILYKWHDSTQAEWSVKKNTDGNVIIENKWKNIPISQIWHFFICDNVISLEIVMKVEENLTIDERRVSVMVTREYKRWINSFFEGKFPRPSDEWEEINLNYTESNSVGVKGEYNLPTLILNFSKSKLKFKPLIQNAPKQMGARMLHAKMTYQREYKPGYYSFFSGDIVFNDNEIEVEDYIEKLRRKLLANKVI